MKTLVISSIVILLFVGCSTPPSKAPLNKNKDVILSAKIQKSKTQLVITNDDTFDWKDVTIVINNDYRYKVDIIPKLSLQKVGFLNFSDGDNKLLDPFEYKIVDVQLYCKTPDGNEGFVSASFK